MFSAFERKVASRYLFSTRKKGFISFFATFSFLGIALGVATLIIVMSVMNGFRQELLKSIIGMRGHVAVASSQPDGLKDYLDVMKTIESEKDVTAAYPMLERQGIITFQSRAQGIVVYGIAKDDIKRRDVIAHNIRAGCLDEFDNDGVLIGWRLADKMNLRVGDHFTLITPEGNETAFGTIPRQKSYRVMGIFDVGMHQYDSNFIFMPMETCQNLYRFEGRVTHLDVFLNNFQRATDVAFSLEQRLGENFRVLDWKHQDQSIFHAVEVERNVMFLILTLLIVIAGFNIASSLIMLVKDKTRDIAILRTMGATQKHIKNIFTSIGFCIGLSGTLFGLGLGLLFSLNIEKIRKLLEKLSGAELFSAEIYFLSKLPAVVDYSDVYTVVAISLGLSVVASFFPARAAAKLDPVEALRF